jgi:hypothetical protein
MLHERWSVEGVDADSPRVPYCFSCSIAARILGTTSGQKRFATASKRAAIAWVHLTAMGSGLKTSLPKRLPASSAADSAEPIVTPAFRRTS